MLILHKTSVTATNARSWIDIELPSVYSCPPSHVPRIRLRAEIGSNPCLPPAAPGCTDHQHVNVKSNMSMMSLPYFAKSIYLPTSSYCHDVISACGPPVPSVTQNAFKSLCLTWAPEAWGHLHSGNDESSYLKWSCIFIVRYCEFSQWKWWFKP